MKKALSFLLAVTMLFSAFTLRHAVFAEEAIDLDAVPEFQSYNDPDFLQYVEDMTLASFEASAGGDAYAVEAVQAVYISQEYIDELAYNS